MNAVGRIGSYLYRGVGTVSGPFHPFGGAIDVIVVEQPDGTFKSSPWYVRFGKFQGVLKNRTNLIKIEVNGVDAGFNMYLAHTGQAYFLREVDDVIEEGGEVYPLSSGDEAESKTSDVDKIKLSLKSKSCNYDAGSPRSAKGKSGFLGYVFGGRPVKESPLKVEDKDDDGSSVGRVSSMERAQIAADLLDVHWSTNIDTRRSFEAKVEDMRQMSGERNLELELDASSSSSVLDETRKDFRVNPPEMLLDSDKIMETPLVASPTQRFIDEKEQDFRESTSVEDFGEIYGEETGVHSFLSHEASGTPCLVENGSSEVLSVTSEGSGKLDLCVESMDVNTTNSPLAQESVFGCDMDSKQNLLSDPEVVNHVILGSTDQADLGSISSSQAESSFGSPVLQVDYKDIHFAVENSEKCQSTGEASSILQSEIPEEEQFSFSDLDYSKPGGSSSGGSTFVDTVKVDGKEIYDENENVTENSKTVSQPINIERKKEETERMVESLPIMLKDNSMDASSCQPLSQSLDSKTSKINSVCSDAETENSPSLKAFKHVIANPEVVELSLCKHLLNEGMGAEAASQAFNTEKLDMEKFASLGPSILENDKLIVKIRGCYFPWEAAAPIILGMVSFGTTEVFEPKGMIAVDRNEKSGDVAPDSGGWNLWPFRRSQNDSETSCKDVAEVEEKAETPIPVKKTVRALTPTSEELASLNLKEGMNSVNFVFSTNLVGTQQVDARIYLWKWNARIVISDVDGTITRSDVLGQFMPLVGIDWSQTGVTHLFSAVKENGYQLIFLSARAISQASVTRQFLVNLKQDGKALPDGPVVISPDGLFPSLFREVIRRAPHEFKIACLEEIRALFPPEHNPFYAGFGNRDTDEISYLKVGIPLGKIFIINPKGEVAVNRRIDTRSYTNLHALVNGMFPATTSSEPEDFNTWNFWKLPSPSVL